MICPTCDTELEYKTVPIGDPALNVNVTGTYCSKCKRMVEPKREPYEEPRCPWCSLPDDEECPGRCDE